MNLLFKESLKISWRRSLTAIIAVAALASALTAGAETVLTTAANGEAILYPAAANTYTVTNGGKVVQVPHGMVYIPAGPFMFGTGTGATNMNLDAYCIGKFPVTEAEYKAFADATHLKNLPAHWRNGTYPEGKANHPVSNVSLMNAMKYCAWVSANTGWNVTIPKAAQWEKAARGTNGFLYPWGDSPEVSYRDGVLKTRFNFNAVTAVSYLTVLSNTPAMFDNPHSPFFGMVTNAGRIATYTARSNATFLAVSPEGVVRGWANHQTWTGFIYTDIFTKLNARGGNTSAVGSYPDGVSSYGCYGMAGNVWNWTTTAITARNGAEFGRSTYEIRGGSWFANAASCRSTSVGEGRVGRLAYNTVGFRIVMIPE